MDSFFSTVQTLKFWVYQFFLKIGHTRISGTNTNSSAFQLMHLSIWKLRRKIIIPSRRTYFFLRYVVWFHQYFLDAVPSLLNCPLYLKPVIKRFLFSPNWPPRILLWNSPNASSWPVIKAIILYTEIQIITSATGQKLALMWYYVRRVHNRSPALKPL